MIPGLRRFSGEGNGNPLQYSCLENPMGRGTWWATVHGIPRVGHDLATKPPPPGFWGRDICKKKDENKGTKPARCFITQDLKPESWAEHENQRNILPAPARFCQRDSAHHLLSSPDEPVVGEAGSGCWWVRAENCLQG